MLARLLVIATCIATPLVVGGCNRVADSKLVGTWRWEDDDNVEEVTLNGDHSFRSLTTYKKISATPSTAIEVGMWRLQGNKLSFDATLTFTKERRQIKRTLAKVAKDSFTMTNFGDRQTVKYQRFGLPVCNSSPATDGHPVRENDLFGSWQMHYNTHDYKFDFMPNARFEMFGLIDGEWGQVGGGNWHITGHQLIWQSDKASYESADPPTRTWTISVVGTDCFAIKEDDSPSYALRRAK